MKKKKVAIAFGITGSYTDILANVLIGLKKHSKKFWDDIAALVTREELVVLYESFVLRKKFSDLSILKSHTYGAAAAIKTRVLKKLHRYFGVKYGPHAIDVYKHYFA